MAQTLLVVAAASLWAPGERCSAYPVFICLLGLAVVGCLGGRYIVAIVPVYERDPRVETSGL